MDYFLINIEEETIKNTDYRRVLYTAPDQQLVLMSIPVGEDIPLEIHPDVDQFIRFEAGNGQVRLGKSENIIEPVSDGSSVNIRRGTWHRVVNVGNEPLKLYSIYSPPEHPEGLTQRYKSQKKINPYILSMLFF